MLNIVRISSPNFNERAEDIPLQYIVLHYTGMKSGEDALTRLTDKDAQVSCHYMIEEDGRVVQLVDDAKRAWHAGESQWRGITDMNSASLGIELVNPGHQFGYKSFPKAQIKSLIELMQLLIKKHKLSGTLAPLAHADIAPLRKEDPGELFPWQELAEAGLGLWPRPLKEDYGHAEDSEVQRVLKALGYDCPETEAYDRKTRAVIVAFQRRYEPLNLTGTPEPETVARMRALLRLMASRSEVSRCA